MMKGKLTDFLTSVAVLEEAELLFAVVICTGTDTTFPPQAPLPQIFFVPDIEQTVSSNAN
jgi:hypothetical protein